MFHHLDLESKKSTSKNIHRILKPGGKFFLVDFGKPHNLIMWMISMVMKNFEHTQENFQGLIPEFLLNEGFSSFKEIESKGSVFGSISFLEASY
jgi:ubiquinone/menaquinone biosynthesis C-methylase UbiE